MIMERRNGPICCKLAINVHNRGLIKYRAGVMHELHDEGATREQIEQALVTLPYVCIHKASIDSRAD
jgi:hypothetical protein